MSAHSAIKWYCLPAAVAVWRANSNSEPNEVGHGSITLEKLMQLEDKARAYRLRMAERLSVSKGSSKITKKSTPRPAPKVYHIHRSCFRERVQELTGNGFEPATTAPPAASNGRLKKFAPPLLGPTSAQRLNADLFPLSPVPILFSPLMDFTPMDWTWADYRSASPISLAYRQLAESLAEQAERRTQVEKPAASPLSPTFLLQSKKNSRDSTSSSPNAI